MRKTPKSKTTGFSHSSGLLRWILLDHKDMAHSFDILTKDTNPELYRLVKLPSRATSIIPSKLSLVPMSEKPRFLFFEPLRWWPALFEFQSHLPRTVASLISWCSTYWLQWILKIHLAARQRLPTFLLRPFTAAFGWLGNLSLLPRNLDDKPFANLDRFLFVKNKKTQQLVVFPCSFCHPRLAAHSHQDAVRSFSKRNG